MLFHFSDFVFEVLQFVICPVGIAAIQFTAHIGVEAVQIASGIGPFAVVLLRLIVGDLPLI